MSKIKTTHVFTSESVSEGHPDKVCDRVSDAILDACLMQDPDSRVACETLCTTDLIVVSGEITTKAKVNWQQIALDAVSDIGYNVPGVGFSSENAKVMVAIHQQSGDISQGVTEGEGLYKEQGAGDQGMMFGYASSETPALMPAPIFYAHKIVEEFARLRKSDPVKYAYLRPDAKSQVSIRYADGHPQEVVSVVVSHQHTPDMPIEKGVAFACGVTIGELRKNYIQPHHQFFMAMGRDFRRKIELTRDSEALARYLHGEEIEAKGDNGWAVVTVDGCAVGGAKIVSGRAKNHYPKGLRI